jgi:hypothetical protein
MVWQKSSEEGDAPFNMAMQYYFNLSELRVKKNNALVDGDVYRYHACLEAIHTEVFFKIKLSVPEEKVIKDSLARIRNMLYSPLPPDRNLASQYLSMILPTARSELMDIDRKLSILMDEYKMIFPRIEARGGLENLRKRMGMPGAQP